MCECCYSGEADSSAEGRDSCRAIVGSCHPIQSPE